MSNEVTSKQTKLSVIGGVSQPSLASQRRFDLIDETFAS